MEPVKVAIVYLAETADFSPDVRRRVAVRAVSVAAFLLVAGALLARLLHFTTGALAIAGGIVLLILGVRMILGQGKPKVEGRPPADSTNRSSQLPRSCWASSWPRWPSNSSSMAPSIWASCRRSRRPASDDR